MKRLNLTFILGIIAFLLTACGFHLRGVFKMPPSFNQIYIQYNLHDYQIASQLRSALTLSDVKLTGDATSAKYILALSNKTITSTQTSVGDTQQTRDFTITYAITISIINNKGEVILSPKRLSDQETLALFGNELLDNSDKYTTLKGTMRQNIVQKIMLLLTAKDTTQKLS